jgi:hypothetical protein
MSNPAIQAQYQLGLNTVQAGLASQGLSNSGAAQTQLEQYGQQFASGAYNQQLQNLINTSNAAYTQNTGATQLGAALQGQTFSQGLEQLGSQGNILSMLGALTGQQGSLQSAGGQLSLAGLQGTGSLYNSSAQLGLTGMQGLLNSLLVGSGATTSSPATAGIIASNQFGNTQQAAQNAASGVGGAISGLSNLVSGIGNLFGTSSGAFDSLGNSVFSTGSSLSDIGSSGVLGDLSGGSGFLSGLFGAV